MKAKYIGKYYGKGFDRDNIYLDYEYRGMTYTIVENRAKGNEPLAWQHRAEQDRIDRILDTPTASNEYKYEGSAQEGFDIFWEYVEQ